MGNSISIGFNQGPKTLQATRGLYTIMAPQVTLVGTGTCVQGAGSTNLLYVNEQNTTTGGSTTTIVDSKQSWPTNFWAGWTFACYATGSGSGFETATVASNTATTATFTSAISTAISSGKVYFFSSAGGAFNYNISGTNYTTGSQYGQTIYGTKPQQYSINLDAFGAPAAILLWSNNYNCWGCGWGNSYGGNGSQGSSGAGNVFGYPSVCRGYVGGGSGTTSASGYTTSVGMGIQLSAMTKAKAHVSAGTYPNTVNNSKWDLLMDCYWYTAADPYTLAGAGFPGMIQVDMQVYPMIMDDTNYAFGYNAAQHHPSVITISGNTYDCVISSKGSGDWGGFSGANGYTVSFYLHPTNIAAGGVTPPGPQLMGVSSSTHDLYAMATWLAGLTSASRDNNSNQIKNASGVVIDPSSSNVPMSTSNYLGAVNCGPEVYYDNTNFDPWIINNFWLAMQSEADGPTSP